MGEVSRQTRMLVTGLCVVIAMVDGFDATAMAYVVPALARQWQVPPGSFGPVFGMTYAGMLLGALGSGILADRVGRKPALLGAMAVFGTLMLATVLATDRSEMLVIRFCTGLGLGGALPNLTALMAEFLPPDRRATGVAIMGTGIPVGSALGGFVTATLLGPLGWQSVFVVGGVLALVCCALTAWKLPESPLYRRPSAGPAHGMAQRTGAALFGGGAAAATLLLWLTLVLNYFDLHGLTAWTPTLLNRAGLSPAQAASVGGAASLFGTLGMVAVGMLMDRLGPFRVIAFTFTATALALFVVVLSPGNVVVLAVALFLATAGVDGANVGMFALAARQYPNATRATGVGWAIGIGRFGSIVGPVVGGALLTVQVGGYSALFLAYTAAGLLAAVAIMALSNALAKRRPAHRVTVRAP